MDKLAQSIILKCEVDSKFREELKILLVNNQMYKEARTLMEMESEKEIDIDQSKVIIREPNPLKYTN